MKGFIINTLADIGFKEVIYSEIFTDIQNKKFDIIWHISTGTKTMSAE